MKYYTFLLVIFFYSNVLFSQNNVDKYSILKNTLDTIRIDTLTFGQLYGAQLDEIFLEYKQINQAYSLQVDSLLTKLSNHNSILGDLKSRNQLLFYISLTSATLLLIFIILFIITILKNASIKKKYNLILIDNGNIKTEIDKIKQIFEQEKELNEKNKEKFEEEKNKLTATIQHLHNEIKTKQQELTNIKEEKVNIENKLKTLESELLHEHRKCEELSAHVNDLLEVKREKDLLIDQLKSENKLINEEYSKKLNILRQLEQQVEVLKEENKQLLNRALKAAEVEEKVNAELKKFIAELQAMLPLPKK